MNIHTCLLYLNQDQAGNTDFDTPGRSPWIINEQGILEWNLPTPQPKPDDIKAVEAAAMAWWADRERDWTRRASPETIAIVEGDVAAINAKLGKAQEITEAELKAAIGAKLQAAEASKETGK